MNKTITLLSSVALLLAAGCTIERQGESSAPDVPGSVPDFDEAAVEGNRELTSIYGSNDYTPVGFDVAKEEASLGEGDLTVLLIVDRSPSMNDAWEGSASKWDITVGALHEAIVGVEDVLTVGALFFPLGEECGVLPLQNEAQYQLTRGALFQKRLEKLGGTGGWGTPMSAAFREANAAIEQAVMDGALAERRFRVVVMTDGEPNCGSDENYLVSMANSWRELGVEVRVMGLPGSSGAARLLDRIAGKTTTDLTVPPPSTWTEETPPDSGYIAPSTSDDVDDSVYSVVR